MGKVKTYHNNLTHIFYHLEDKDESKKRLKDILDQMGYGYRSTEDSIVSEWYEEETRTDGFDRQTSKLVFTFDESNVTRATAFKD